MSLVVEMGKASEKMDDGRAINMISNRTPQQNRPKWPVERKRWSGGGRPRVNEEMAEDCGGGPDQDLQRVVAPQETNKQLASQ